MPYQIRDLMINVIGSGGGTSLPADDTTPVPTPVTPIAITAAVLAITPQVEFTAPILKEALSEGLVDNRKADSIARAALGSPDGSPAFVQINRELAATVAGAAVFQQGGSAGMPDPNCNGTSMETIPTPITPVVHKAATVLQASHLPRLKAQLTEMLRAVEAAEKTLIPQGKTAAALASTMKSAIDELETATVAARR
jgi:hypothetical protein